MSANFEKLNNVLCFKLGRISTSLALMGICSNDSCTLTVALVIVTLGTTTTFLDGIYSSMVYSLDCLKLDVAPESMIAVKSVLMSIERNGGQYFRDAKQ